MSRKIIGKVCVRGDLVAQTPISVGGLGAGEHVDLDVAVDGAGRFYIPGTSLAGPMRAWLSENVESEKLLDELFGFIEQTEDKGQASSLFIEDSPAQGAVRERRHGIALREDTGTVADGFFYTRALLPRGTRFPLEMELDIDKSIDKSPESGTEHPAGALALLLKALCEGKVRFGACKTRGMGALRLEGLRVDYYDFVKDTGALDRWLATGGSSEDRRSLWLDRELKLLERFGTPKRRERHLFEVLIHWRALSPVMVKAGRDGAETDMLPLMSGVGGTGKIAPVIPGSSVKGTLRAQARRILHTLFDPKGEKRSEKPKYLDLLDALFGSAERAGRLSVNDIYYRPGEPVSPDAWLKEDAGALNAVTERRQHVAIDRFTGGASEGALYSVRPVRRDKGNQEGGWEPIRLSLDLSGFSEKQVCTALALLKLLLRDLRDGYLPIGFGSRRGLGEIVVPEGGIRYLDFPSDAELQLAWNAFVDEGGAFSPQQEEANGGV